MLNMSTTTAASMDNFSTGSPDDRARALHLLPSLLFARRRDGCRPHPGKVCMVQQGSKENPENVPCGNLA